jgi:antitoxin component of MazEF toxin-antitoxin module
MKSKVKQIDNEYFIPIPNSLIQELTWEDGDEILVETTLDCYPNGEVNSIILANITKHNSIVEESV